MDRTELRIKVGVALNAVPLLPTNPVHGLAIDMINDAAAVNGAVDLMKLRNAAGEYMKVMYALSETIDTILKEQNQQQHAQEKGRTLPDHA